MFRQTYFAILLGGFGCQALESPDRESASTGDWALVARATSSDLVRSAPPTPPAGGRSHSSELAAASQCERVNAGAFGCPGYRWVGRVTTGGDCPPPESADWELSRPFADARGFLRAICSYEWIGADSPDDLPFAGLSDPSAPELAGDLVEIAKDCQALAKADRECKPEVEEEVISCSQPEFAAAIEQQFLQAADAPSWSAEDLAAFVNGRVILALIDAKPRTTTGPLPGRLQHGNYAKRIAELLGCATGAGCAFERRFYTALSPTPAGDVAGSAFDAALAAYAALKDAAAADADLVLEFGLGFRQHEHCTDDTITVRALLEVVKLATCEHDAVTLAPVGNLRPGDENAAILYPSAWQDQTCAAPSTLPLVTAVSAVDLQGAPLSSALSEGLKQAPLLAVGGPVAFDSPDGLLPLREGTSIATATAGAIAALLRAHRPELDARALLERLRNTPISSAGAPSLAVVTACAVLAEACAAKPGDCTVVDAVCGTPKLPPWANGDALVDLVNQLPVLGADGSLTSTRECPSPGTLPEPAPNDFSGSLGGAQLRTPADGGAISSTFASAAGGSSGAGSLTVGDAPVQDLDACVTSGERGDPGVPNGLIFNKKFVFWSSLPTWQSPIAAATQNPPVAALLDPSAGTQNPPAASMDGPLAVRLLVSTPSGDVWLPASESIPVATAGMLSFDFEALLDNDAEVVSAKAEWSTGFGDPIVVDLPVYQP